MELSRIVSEIERSKQNVLNALSGTNDQLDIDRLRVDLEAVVDGWKSLVDLWKAQKQLEASARESLDATRESIENTRQKIEAAELVRDERKEALQALQVRVDEAKLFQPDAASREIKDIREKRGPLELNLKAKKQKKERLEKLKKESLEVKECFFTAQENKRRCETDLAAIRQEFVAMDNKIERLRAKREKLYAHCQSSLYTCVSLGLRARIGHGINPEDWPNLLDHLDRLCKS